MISEYIDPYVGKYLNFIVNPLAGLLGKIVGDKYARDAAYLLVIALVIIIIMVVMKKFKK